MMLIMTEILSKLAFAVTLVTCIWKVTCFNLGWDMDYPY
jgi:hypothetical protein